jgi:hypothetical protein
VECYVEREDVCNFPERADWVLQGFDKKGIKGPQLSNMRSCPVGVLYGNSPDCSHEFAQHVDKQESRATGKKLIAIVNSGRVYKNYVVHFICICKTVIVQ